MSDPQEDNANAELNNQLLAVPIFAYGFRHILMLECEKSLLGLAIMVDIMVAYVNLSRPYMWFFCVFLLIVLIKILRKCAKYDPILSKVFQRYFMYKKFYSAGGSIYSNFTRRYREPRRQL